MKLSANKEEELGMDGNAFFFFLNGTHFLQWI